MEHATLSDLADAARYPRLVIKIGSSLLIDRTGQVRRKWLASLIDEVRELIAGGQQVVIVSSGAIALGAARLGRKRSEIASLADAQATASVGQIALASLWSEMLGAHRMIAAQVLLTLSDFEDRRSYLNASATFCKLMSSGVVPVVNENDSVATEEIRFGDNDRLAARVAQVAEASAVILLSDVDGLYDRDPGAEGATLVERVDGIDTGTMAMASAASSSGLGSGGMVSKLQAAQIAERAGIALAIVNGTYEAPLTRAFEGNIGTVFVPQRRDAARKAWLGGRLAPAGVLTVDAGCAAALAKDASLLAAGLLEVAGEFMRGDLVAIHGPKGERLGQGLVEYNATECRAIRGLKHAEQAEKLGYAPRSAVIHRDHWVAA